MKYALVLIFVIFNIFLIGTSKAAPNTREKRSLSQERCPQGSTDKQCLEYATRKSENLDQCHKFFLNGGSIEWQTCGTVNCGTNTRIVEEDRSKPYPACCVHCEVIDKNKPAMSSGVM